MAEYIVYPVRAHKMDKIKFYTVSNGVYPIASFWCDTDDGQTEMQAYSRARAYCDQLNEEHRKETQK